MIQVDNLSVQVGSFRLQGVSFEISAGEYAVLMGRTGTGKTTLLEVIAGLKPLASGRVFLGGREVTDRKPAERNIGYVPQDGALFSTMSVREHLAFALDIRGTPRKETERRVQELAELLEIQHLLGRSTRGLSGGEKQRVAIGRALSFRPSTLLLDEPMSAIDDGTRQQMYHLLEHVRQRTGVTTLHVTHNLGEALRLADRLFRLEGSRICEGSLPAARTARDNGGPDGECGEPRHESPVAQAPLPGRRPK